MISASRALSDTDRRFVRHLVGWYGQAANVYYFGTADAPLARFPDLFI